MKTPAPKKSTDGRERRLRDHGGTGMPQGRRRLSQILLSSSLLRHTDLLKAVAYANTHQTTLTDAVVILGYVTEVDSYAALGSLTGMPLVDLADIPPNETAVRLLPERVARKYCVLPLHADEKVLTCAVAQPFDDQTARDVAFATGRKIKTVLACRSHLMPALDRAYGHAEGPAAPVADTARGTVSQREAFDIRPTTSPIDLCQQLIAKAAKVGASDIHIEPLVEGAAVRYRIAGILESVVTLPPGKVRQVVNRFKVLAKADISVRNKPQDGAFRMMTDRPIDVRLSTLPTVHGEAIVMRVIDTEAALQTLDTLGYDADKLEALRWALERPDGLVLVTGPPGSGKTTVLYAALHHLNNGTRNIVTIEDPVERRVAGVNQIAVNSRETPLAGVLSSVLRQDPNVIMVGEIRDPDVAQLVGQAAYTGHLVLSSLHTGDSISAITRLLNLGLEPFRVAESLTAIVAQRLVRRLCPDCRVAHSDIESRRLAEAAGLRAVPNGAGQGCGTCRGTGYAGRSPVVEMLIPDDNMRDAIAGGGRGIEIRVLARAAGWPSMREGALAMVAAGATSIEEVDRVLASDTSSAVKATAPKARLLSLRRAD